MNDATASQNKQRSRVTFQSLKNIFNLAPNDILGERRAKQIQLPKLTHFLPTKISPDAEFCRQAMTLACQPVRASLRSKIKAQDPAILALYRGFSRFMLEDLALHPHSQSISRAKRKKTAEKVSFEMMLRNQAYSNLVELVFPDHVRLSIHAHKNSGPKFGINLFDRASTQVVNNLQDLSSVAETSHDLLHIPTPWHNAAFRVSGLDHNFVAKSKVVQEALDSDHIQAHWIHGDFGAGHGGYFEVIRHKDTKTALVTMTESSKPAVVVLSSHKEAAAPVDQEVLMTSLKSRTRRNSVHQTSQKIRRLFQYCKRRALEIWIVKYDIEKSQTTVQD